MPITNTQGAFNTGRDIAVVLIGPFGQVQINNVTGFECKQETATVKADRLDGIQLMAELPKGWSGTIEFDRGDSAVDDLIAAVEQAWLAGGSYIASTLYEYISETNGSQSIYQFDNVALKLDDAGAWKGDSTVKGKLAFIANRRQRV